MKYYEIVKLSNDFVDGTAYDLRLASNLKRLVIGKATDSTKFKKGEEFDVFTVSGTRRERGVVAFPIKYPNSSDRGDKNLSWSGIIPYKYDKSSGNLRCLKAPEGKICYANVPDLPFPVYVCLYFSTKKPRVLIVSKCKVECNSSDSVSIDIGGGVKIIIFFESTELKPGDLYSTPKGFWNQYRGGSPMIASPQIIVRGISVDEYLNHFSFSIEEL